MKNKLTFLIYFLTIESLHAQFNQQWVRNFCCFDSVQPHTFSYPLYKELNHDTLVLSFYEDSFLKYAMINTTTGNFIQIVTFLLDTVQSPFYFGGGTSKVAGNFVTSAVKYEVNNGTYTLFHSSVSNTISMNWRNDFVMQGGMISKPLSNISGSAFYTSEVSDSIRIYNFTSSGSLQWIFSAPVNKTGNIEPPYLFLNSINELVMLVYETDSVNLKSSIHFIKIDGNGSLMLDSVYTNSKGTTHIAMQVNDTLKFAFIDSSQTIAFIDIDLLSFNVTKYFNTNIVCWSELTKYSVDTMTGNYYLKTADHLLGYTAQDSLLFNISLPTEAQAQYDHGEIVFDSLDLFMAYSIHDILNIPPNNDIISFRINKSTGAVEASTDYNDNRNTDDNFLDNFLDGNNFFIIFANNFDNGSILQEETQLGIVKYTSMTSGVNSNNCCNSTIHIFPNPFHSALSITSESADINAEYCIYNITGGIVTRGFINNNGSINMESLSNGVYTMVFMFRNGNSSFHKIIKL